MTLTDTQGLLVLLSPLVAILAGFWIPRWWVPEVPLATLAGLHLALSRGEWYSRVPEDWQATAYFLLFLSAVASAASVAVAKRARPRQAPRRLSD